MFADTFNALKVKKGTVAVAWAGQAGFIFKTAGGKVIAIDPYLSDYVYECFKEQEGLGYKRLSPPLFDVGDIGIDVLLSSHEHGDHLDMISIPKIMADKKTVCYANGPSMAIAKEAGLDMSRFTLTHIGDEFDMGEFALRILDCDHGELCPEATGLMLDFGFGKIYYSGDTCYNKEALKAAIAEQPEVALLPINGAYGNLDSKDASLLAADLGAKYCIPHHFWTFANHFGNPREAIDEFPKNAPGCVLQMMTPGEIFVYPPEA